jgi:hypothetical protein
MVVRQKVTKATKRAKNVVKISRVTDREIVTHAPPDATVFDMFASALSQAFAHAGTATIEDGQIKTQVRSIVISAEDINGQAKVEMQATSPDGTKITRKITRRA